MKVENFEWKVEEGYHPLRVWFGRAEFKVRREEGKGMRLKKKGTKGIQTNVSPSVLGWQQVFVAVLRQHAPGTF